MVFDDLREIIAEDVRVDPDEITMATDLIDDLDMDSLELVEIMMAIEEHFGIEEVPEEELENLRTVGDIVEYIEAHS
ncbi:MAG: acyl carrier protein [Ruminococcaceae bacterium]|nr:acyl carrier protein [Oscillospiraceae bacterium]